MTSTFETFCNNFKEFNFPNLIIRPRKELKETYDTRITATELFTEAREYAKTSMIGNSDDDNLKKNLRHWFELLVTELFNSYTNPKSSAYLEIVHPEKKSGPAAFIKYLTDDDVELLALAFTPSDAGPNNNEVMEFVGDSIVNAAIVRYLTNKVVLNESRYTNLKFHYMDKKTFSEISRLTGIDRFLRWNMNEISQSDSENAFEAFIYAADRISSNIRARMYQDDQMVAADYNLVNMLIAYIFDHIKIADIVKPDITFISEMLNFCSVDKKRRAPDTYTIKNRKTTYRLNVSEKHIENMCVMYNLYPRREQIQALFSTVFHLGYLEEKIAKTIVYKYLVSELKKYDFDVFNFITLKSFIIIKRQITKTADARKEAYSKCNSLFFKINQKKYYVDTVESTVLETTVLRLKILPITFNDISNQCDKTIRLLPGERNSMIYNVLVDLASDYDALVERK